MSEIFKTSGKRFKLASSLGPRNFSGKKGSDSEWSFEQRPGGWWVGTCADGRRVRISAHELGGAFSASLPSAKGTLLWQGEIQKEKSYSAGGHSGSDSDWVAQFPGKVRKVLVATGASVKEGEPLLLVEAMKMEFPVKAPYDCKIVKILVQENQQLSPGDRFFEIEVSNGG